MAGRQPITIRDIAKAAEVSKTTVSRYLNGKYEFMSDATRQRIEQVISETGYRPNRMAGSLKAAHSDLIGLVLSDPNANLTPFLVGSICDGCACRGQKMIVVVSHGNEQRERDLVMDLLDQQVDGLIVTTGSNFDFYRELNEERLPVVLADRVESSSPMDWVAVNHYAGCAQVTNRLIDQGYRHIAVLARNNAPQAGTIALRRKSVEDTCLERFGDDGHCQQVRVREEQLTADILQCLRECNERSRTTPTAIFVAEGSLMGRLVCGFYQLGFSLSPALTICGYDLWNFGQLLSSQIYTIDQPLTGMGAIATELLAQRLAEEQEPREPRHVLLDCHINGPEA